MRLFVEQHGGKTITTDSFIDHDGVMRKYYYVEDGVSIKLFSRDWYSLDQVKKLCQCVKEVKKK
mgnify:FL=1